jgi:molybdopterin-guanine dinucleotide biosynthesis protein B
MQDYSFYASTRYKESEFMSKKESCLTPMQLPPRNTAIPIICISGYSGSGKTTLMVKLIALLSSYGLRVGTIKHDVHGFDIDKPGKDSYRHKEAGASSSVITSPKQIGLVTDVDHDHSPEELRSYMPNADIILAEGFKRSRLPKIEVFRPETGKGPACKDDPFLIAVVSDAELHWDVRQFSTDDVEPLAAFILHNFQMDTPQLKSPQISRTGLP